MMTKSVSKTRYKSFFTILVLCGLFLGCQQHRLSADDTKIIILLVDHMARPLPPPPKADTNDAITDQVMDSLNKIKLKVAIHPRMVTYKDALDRHPH